MFVVMLVAWRGSRDDNVGWSTTLVKTDISTATGLIVLTFCTGIHGPHGMYPNDFDDPLSSPLAPP